MANRVMSRAWEIFRTPFNYPTVHFRSIGRDCFRGCLLLAWQEHREAEEVRNATTESLQALADGYEQEIHDLKYRGWGTHVERRKDTLRLALAPIAAELARREPEPVALQLAA